MDNYTVSDVCDSDVTVTHNFSNPVIDYCTGADIVVTWTATDDCGNTSTASATIEVAQDVTAPSLTAPSNLPISCTDNQQNNSAAITDWLDNYTVSDVCDSDVTVTHNFSNPVIDYCTGADIVVTWTATDDCGNTSTVSATIEVAQDVTAPSLTAPANLPISCTDNQQNNSAAITDWLDNYTVSDVCDSDVTVTHNFSNPVIDYCTGADIVVTWTATDDCGNTSTVSATIEVAQDVTAPSLTAPANITVSCTDNSQNNSAAITDWLDNYITSDVCDSDVAVTHNFSNPVIDYCTGADIVVTWTATDDCGNTTTKTATIIVEADVTPPTWDVEPQDLTVECGPNAQSAVDAWVAAFGNGIASDACTSQVTYSILSAISGTGCGGTFAATYTFMATDGCGNTSTFAASVSVVDTQAPTITSPAKNKVVECDGDGNLDELGSWLAANGEAQASDICSSWSWNNPVLMSSVEGCGNTVIYTYMFQATDACGNTSANTIAIFTIEDSTAPSWTVFAQDTVVNCEVASITLAAWLEEFGGAEASDICGGVSYVYDLIDELDQCGNSGTYTY